MVVQFVCLFADIWVARYFRAHEQYRTECHNVLPFSGWQGAKHGSWAYISLALQAIWMFHAGHAHPNGLAQTGHAELQVNNRIPSDVGTTFRFVANTVFVIEQK